MEERWNSLWHGDGQGHQHRKLCSSFLGDLTAVGNTLYFTARRRNQRIRIVEERWNSQWYNDGQGHQHRQSLKYGIEYQLRYTHSHW